MNEIDANRDDSPSSAAAEEERTRSLDVYALASSLCSLPEPRMRSAVLASRLTDMSRVQAAWVLDVFASIGRSGGAPYDVGLVAAVDMVTASIVPYDVLREYHAAATEAGLESARELLYSVVEHEVDEQEEASAPRALTPGTRPLTLGERKSLARSWRRDVLERLLVDPSVDVITLLLDNPHVTESDVLKIATSRRAPPAAMGLILAHRRWNTRSRVRKAVVLNPRSPLALVLRSVGLLGRAEQLELLHDGTLPPIVRDAVARRLRMHA